LGVPGEQQGAEPKIKVIKKRGLHSPGIEPGTSAWKADILPLNYECVRPISLEKACAAKSMYLKAFEYPVLYVRVPGSLQVNR
jgi:hypothetical protein